MKAVCFFSCLYLFMSAHAQQVEIENLGDQVNSVYSELNPIIAADGKTVYFIRANHPGNTKGEAGSQDIWFAKMNGDGSWQEPQHAGTHLNRSDYNILFNVSTDGNKMMIGGAYVDGVNWGTGFSFIERNGDKWSEPHYLDIKKLDKLCKGEYLSACLSADNKTIILGFSEEEDSKINNLYVSFLQPNNTWSKPKPLQAVNSAYDETTPFLSSDGVTLYFASDRPGGMGSKDIYVSKRLDDTWQQWTVPVNLGAPINTEQAEGYYTIPASGNMAYMVSGRNTIGKTDIVRISTKEATKPKPVILLSGKVLNAKTQAPVEAEISYEILPAGTAAGTINFISLNGDYQLILPYGKHYGISAKAKGFIPVSVSMDLGNEGDYRQVSKDLYLVPIETGQVVRLNNIFFESGKSVLSKESYPELNRLAKIMKDNAGLFIEIAGHTDDVGNDQDNLLLSMARSLAVEKYLEQKGIKDNRVVSVGFGEAKPVAGNETDEGKQMNRRVEFKILQK